MATTPENYNGSYTVSSAGTLTLSTSGKYLDRNISVTVPAASTAADGTYTPGIASGKAAGTNTVTISAASSFTPDISKVTTDSADAAGVNIQAVVGTKATSEPTSGYYVAFSTASQTAKTVTANGSYATTTDGFASTNDAAVTGSNSTTVSLNGSGTKYFPITAAVLGHNSSSVSASTSAITLGTKTTTAPTSGPYITVKGSGSVKATTAGYIPVNSSKSSTETTAYYPITASTIDNTAISMSSNVDGTAAGVDSVGVEITIPAGYYAETTLTKTLTDVLPDLADPEATAAYILNGYTAYDDGGKLITGTMSKLSPSSSYFVESSGTSTTTGLAATAIGAGYLEKTYYVKNGAGAANSASASIAAGTGDSAGTTNTSLSLLATAPSSGTYYTITATGKGSSKITSAGWMGTGALGEASTTKSYYIPKATFTTNSADVAIDTADGSNAGVNVSAVVGTKATTEPTSGYYLAFKGSGSSKINTAGYITAGATGSTTTSGAKYFPITAAVLGADSGSVSASGSSMTLGTKTTTKPSSGYYITVQGSGKVKCTTAGYIPTTYTSTSSNTATAYYPVTAAAATISNGAATAAKLTYTTSVTATSASDSGAGILSSAPASGNYITIAPSYSGESNGSVAAPSKSLGTAGYMSAASQITLPSSAVSVSITKTAGTSRYISIFDGTYTFTAA